MFYNQTHSRKTTLPARVRLFQDNTYFEPEADIDISYVAEELIALERQMRDTDRVNAGYCQERGIQTPF